MDYRIKWTIFGLLLACCICPAGVFAQDEASTDEAEPRKQAESSTDVSADQSAEEKPEPSTTSDPKIPVAHLQLKLRPLTKDELATEAEGWRNLVRKKVEQISQVQISAVNGGTTTTEPATKENGTTTKPVTNGDMAKLVTQLQDERTALIDRLNTVLTAWESKGGETEEYQKYAAAVSGIDLNIHDASALGSVVWEWLISENGGQRWMWNILKFLAILLVFYILAGIAGRVVERLAGRIKGASVLLKKFLSNFAKQTVLIVGFIVALSALEVNISPLLAAIGGAAFVIGFALQGTLSNFASGLVILGYRPFDVGDVIEAAGISGIVDSMNLISTKIRTFDNKVMIVPNNKIATDTITNATASTTRRVDMTFGIGYDDDIAKALEILKNIITQHELVLQDPAPVIQLNELADSSVNFIVRPWTKTADYWTLYWEVTRQVKDAFDANGISIPFPQRDVHIYQEKMAGSANSSSQ